MVRRDTIPFIKTVYNRLRDVMFMEGKSSAEIKVAVLDVVQSLLDRMCANKMDAADLVLRKRITKPIEDYKIPPPHVCVADKLRKRHEAGEKVYGVPVPNEGDYVSYVQVMPDAKLTLRQQKALRKGQLAEDPTYWSNNRDKILLNTPIYLERLMIISELVSHFIDPDRMKAMIETARLGFLRRYKKNHSIEEYMATAAADGGGTDEVAKRRRDSTARALAVNAKRKKHPIGRNTAKKRTQPTLARYFSKGGERDGWSTEVQ